jgi:glycosyltransferase involved in cell wall biosynthesis
VESIRNGVLKVIADASVRERLINKGYENAKRFSLKNVAGAYNKLYQQVVANQQ